MRSGQKRVDMNDDSVNIRRHSVEMHPAGTPVMGCGAMCAALARPSPAERSARPRHLCRDLAASGLSHRQLQVKPPIARHGRAVRANTSFKRRPVRTKRAAKYISSCMTVRKRRRFALCRGGASAPSSPCWPSQRSRL